MTVTRPVLDSLYRGILGRDPDPSGVASYVGQDIGLVLGALLSSNEFQARQAAINSIPALQQQVADLQAQLAKPAPLTPAQDRATGIIAWLKAFFGVK